MQYSKLAKIYQELESTTKRLEKTYLLSEFLKTVSDEDLEHVMLLLEGRVFPAWDSREIGVAARTLLKSISVATGKEAEKIEELWKKIGDLGEVAEQLMSKKTQATLFSKTLSSKKVFENLQKIAEMEGEGTVDRKVKLVAELLTSSSPEEAKYIIRTTLEELRIGLGEGTIRDAIVWENFGKEIGIKYNEKEKKLDIDDKIREKYNLYSTAVQESYDVVNDFAKVAKLARKGLKSLGDVSLEPGKPMKVMLYPKAKDMEEAFETVGIPAILEFKYDGFRLVISKKKNKIMLFTRRLENVTEQFPDVVEAVEKYVSGEEFILDSEAVGFDVKTKKYIAFQNISQRIRRKYDIKEIAEKFPVEINVFDIVFYEGENLFKKPFEDRRKILEKIIKIKPFVIKVAEQFVTSEIKEADTFYKKSLEAGNEGVMVKNRIGIYKPGSRVGYGVKVKPVMETLDLVIVGAELGEGKRSEWLSSFTVACRDNETGEFLELGQVGTGIKEKEAEGEDVSFDQLTKLLKPLVISEKGKEVKVKPRIIIEVKYEEIQKSPTYNSGYALRFPRLVRLREDKSIEDVSTLKEIEKYYYEQRGRGK